MARPNNNRQNNQKIDSVLIANRGEIACRIIRTLRKMDIKSIAVYSDADANSLHVQMADEAYYIGQSGANESYLNIRHILDALVLSGAQAVHPGYGFLSENYEFAKTLHDAKIRLIGPSPKVIKQMGDKIEAKKVAQAAGVSTVPGYIGVINSAEEAIEIAKNIGFPVILKAAAGGGGRGMRVVHDADGIPDAFESATNESKNSFRDDRIFIEKFITNPRHIEIQVIADTHGNVVCLGERECSIQRHHQKIIEEAPSPFIDEETRNQMYEQVLSLAKQVGYSSAGTVEFIVDENRNFYFLEMNTRLQVEHCVTELVTGIDIVEQMVNVAMGKKLPFTQADVKLNGWAIESRIYAEDPSRGFLPSSGRITTYTEPQSSSNVRIDTGVFEGGEVSMFYDPMIAKLCTYAPTREETIKHMQAALDKFVIRGISHNISFLQAIMANERFQKGDMSTNFIDAEYPGGFLGAELTSESTSVILCVGVHIFLMEAQRSAQMLGQLRCRPKEISTRWVVTVDDLQFPIVARPYDNGFRIRFERNRFSTSSNWILGSRLFRGMVNGKEVSVRIDRTDGGYILTYGGTSVPVTIRSPRVAELERFIPRDSSNDRPSLLTAPISGSIVSIKVEPGQTVQAKQDVLTIEAMKMENIISAPTTAKVGAIHVKPGDVVNTGQILVEWEYE